MKLNELKKAKPVTTKSSGTDDPSKYIGGWEAYDEPQGINDRQDQKVLAKESDDDDMSVSPEDKKSISLSKKAPKQSVRANVKALSARGKPAQLNARKIQETIRKPFVGSLTSEYEIIDDNDRSIGYCRVEESVIVVLDFIEDASQSYAGEILSAMLQDVTREADHQSANLSIEMIELNYEFKTLLERFGFRMIGGTVMQRNYGAARPPSVHGISGL